MTTMTANPADATDRATGAGARRFGRRELGLLLGLAFAGLLTGGGLIAAAAEPEGGLRAAAADRIDLGALVAPMRPTR